jgi:hypothetical protein
MEYLQKAILEKYKEHWYTLRDAGFIKNLNKESVTEIESAYQKLVDPNFFVNKWCMSCVAEMIDILYRVTKFDELDKEPVILEEVELVNPVVIEELKTEPKKRGRKKKS